MKSSWYKAPTVRTLAFGMRSFSMFLISWIIDESARDAKGEFCYPFSDAVVEIIESGIMSDWLVSTVRHSAKLAMKQRYLAIRTNCRDRKRRFPNGLAAPELRCATIDWQQSHPLKRRTERKRHQSTYLRQGSNVLEPLLTLISVRDEEICSSTEDTMSDIDGSKKEATSALSVKRRVTRDRATENFSYPETLSWPW